MLRIHFSATDFARTRWASRPAPLLELNTVLIKMFSGDDGLLLGRWRRQMLRSTQATVRPLGELVPGRQAPNFLDVYADTLEDGFETIRATPPDRIRSEIERVHATSASPPAPWIRDLHRGRSNAWEPLFRSQRATFDATLRPVWPLIQDLHQAEFTRHALTLAEHGLGTALADAVPGSRLQDDTWECPAPTDQEINLEGRGLVLLPTFHWSGGPLPSTLPDGPVTLTYAAGPGLPLPLTYVAGMSALAGVLGRTRVDLLLLLGQEHTGTDLARRLRVSNATVSAHTVALRQAGLITTVRAGRSVLHRRTALGSLLLGRRDGSPPG